MKRFVVGCLLVASPALAVPKYTKQEAQITASQTALTKPAQRAKEEKGRPGLAAGDVFKGVGEQLKAVTDTQIKVLQKLIDNTSDDDPEKPDYLFRMAELYAEQEHYYNFRAREIDQKLFDAQQAGKTGLMNQYSAQQKDFEKREKDWLKAAVKEYVMITGSADRPNEKFKSYKRMDYVLFYLAYLLTEQKREDAARPFFRRLIKDYPSSQFIPNAYLSFGDYYFEQKDMEHALQFYDKVLAFPQSSIFGFAMYKTGWCWFNLQDFKKALEIFVRVVRENSKDKSKISLLKEARKDAVRAYSQIDTASVDKAWPFFQNLAGGDTKIAMGLLEMLGEYYNAQGKFDPSIRVYRQLMKNEPTSPKLCNWQQEVLRNTLSKNGSRATPDSVQELERLAAVYERYKGMQGVKQEALGECRDNTAGSLRELATTWHKEAQKTNVTETYALAQSLYREYIRKFPQEKDIYPMTFYYGELLFKLGATDQKKFCEAAPIYTDVVKLDPSDKAKYRNEAAYAAVISWKNCLNVDDSGQAQATETTQIRKGKSSAKVDDKKKAEEEELATKPKAIPEKQQKMLDAFETYIKYVPNSPELVTIKYRKARTYYEYNHFDEAVPLFKDIAEKHRDSDLAIYSVNLLFDCENILKQFDTLEGDLKKYCPVEQFKKDQDFDRQCATLQNGLARKRIEQWEKDGKWRQAADTFVKLAQDHPDDPRVAELWFNAGYDYEKAKAVGLAIQARSKLIELKPDDPLSKKSVYLLGRAYQDIAAYTNAADAYEKFAIKYPGEKAPYDASTAMYTAAFFRRGLGESDKAIEDANQYVKLYGGRGKEYEDKSAGVFFELARIYEQQKQFDKLEKHLRDYLKQWGTKGGIDRQIVANVKLGELAWRQSCPVAGVNGACIDISRVRASSATRVVEKARKSQKGKKKKKGLALPAQCGPETKSKITLHERKPALAKEAQAYFAAALRLFAGGAAAKKIPGKDETERNVRLAIMMNNVAQARMMQGDQEYERFLSMKIPEKLDFTPVDTSASPAKQKAMKKKLEENAKKFKGWLDNKTKQTQVAQKSYQDVIKLGDASWAIAAAARIGQVFQDFSDQLYTAPVPKAGNAPSGMSQDDFEQLFHDAYCDQMTDTAEPLEAKAVEGLSTCLNKSTELSWFNEWSTLCESELNQIKPAEYPLASEIRGTPGYFDKHADSPSIISELKQ